MLDLDARVHLDKVVISRFVNQELDCTRGYIAHIPRDLDCIRVKTASDFLRHAPRGRKLHDLLVAALKRAVAFKQVDDVAVPVAQHLHLDVLGLDEEFLDKDILVAERLLRLALDLREIHADILRAVAAAHSAAAASSCCLEQHRVAEFLRECDRVVHIGQRARRAGDGGYAALVRDGLGGQLVAHLIEDLGRRADERDARLLAGAGKCCVFGQKAVSGVDRIHIAAFGKVNNPGYIQICCQRAFVFADQICLVRSCAVQAVHIFLRVDRHCTQVKIITCAENTQCDLAAVGYQNLLEFTDFQMSPVLSSYACHVSTIPFFSVVSNRYPAYCTKFLMYGRIDLQ